MKLTEKQQRFADEYLIDLNATQAAIRAGYSKKTARQMANENLSKPNIKKYIDESMAEMKKKLVADQEEIMMYLSALVRGEHTEQTLRGVGEGAQVIDDIDVSAKDRIKAAELLGKRYAMWTDKQQMDVSGVVQFVDDIDD